MEVIVDVDENVLEDNSALAEAVKFVASADLVAIVPTALAYA